MIFRPDFDWRKQQSKRGDSSTKLALMMPTLNDTAMPGISASGAPEG